MVLGKNRLCSQRSQRSCQWTDMGKVKYYPLSRVDHFLTASGKRNGSVQNENLKKDMNERGQRSWCWEKN